MPTGAQYRSTQFRQIRSRVLAAIPGWYQWPRVLRLLLASLPDIGSSDLAIEDWCKRRGFSWARVKKQIAAQPDFQAALDRWRSQGDLPAKQGWRNSLTKAHLQILIAESEGFNQYLDLIELRAGGRSGELAKSVTQHFGWDEAGDAVEDQPEIRLTSGQKASGVVVDEEDLEAIHAGEEEDEELNSLADWALTPDSPVEQTLP